MFKKIINLKTGEGGKVFVLFIYFFALVSVSIVGKTARDAYFLSRFDKELLPLMFVAIAVVMAGAIAVYTALSKKFKMSKLLVSSNMVFIGSLVLFQFRVEGILIPILYIWMEIISAVTQIQFWTLAGQTFGPREAKRIYGLIGGGGALAAMLSGSALKPIVTTFGTDELLFITAGLLGLGLLMFLKAKSFRRPKDVRKASSSKPKSKTKALNPYLWSIATVIGLASIVTTLVDYQFKMIASNTFNTESELVGFFGQFYAATGFVSLIVQFFLTNPILTQFGVLGGLLILPSTLIIGSATLIFNPMLWSAVATKFSDQTFKFTIDRSALEILWLPIPPERQKVARPLVTGTIKSSLEGGAGLATFILVKFIELQYLSIIVLCAIAVWLVTAFRLKSGYVKSLQEAVEKRQLNFEDLTFDVADSAMVKTIEDALNVEDPNQQLFVLDLVKDIPLHPWKSTLQKIFNQSSIEVQSLILSLTMDDPDTLANDQIIEAFKKGGALGDRAAAVIGHRNLIKLLPDLNSQLESSSPESRASAAAAILNMDSEFKEKAKTTLQELLDDPDPYTASLALQNLSSTPELIPSERLNHLLLDEASEVRMAALGLIQDGRDKSPLSAIIQNLAFRKTVIAAREALKHFSETEVLQSLEEAARGDGASLNLKLGILHTLKLYPSAGSAYIVHQMMDRNNPRIYRESVDALLSIARQNPLPETLLKDLHEETKFVARTIYEHTSELALAVEGNSGVLFDDHLNHRIHLLLPVLLKLGIMDTPNTQIETCIHTLQASDSGRMGFVLELLEQIFSKTERDMINPLIEPMEALNRFEIGKKFFPDIPSNSKYFSERGILSGHSWTTALYLDKALQNANKELLSSLDWDQVTLTDLTKEVISWHAFNNGQEFTGIIPESFILDQESLPMYSSLEKTILLKSVNLFQSIPAEDLSRIAQIAEETRMDAGTPIFQEGDFGDSIFIIMDGKVKIHKGDQDIATLGKGDCLGEMALLDQDPRSADATVEEDSILLKITGEGFYELMSGNMDIMQGIVKLLTGRLREAIK